MDHSLNAKVQLFSTLLVETFMPLRFMRYLLLFIVATISSAANAELPTLGDPTLGSFSSKDEAKLGMAFYHSLRANLEFVDDLQMNHYISSLGQKLVTHSDAPGSHFRFYIIKANSINAFAGPDAHLGIHSGLILKAKNESQLAGVMAHEIAHVSQRHIARAVDASGNVAVASFATILAAILLGSQDPQAAQAVLMTGIASAQQASLNFTRQNEYEADRIGIGLLQQSGINPKGMVEFFELLLAENRNEDYEYLRTHPLNVNRVSEANDRLQKSSSKLPDDSKDFQFARARLAVLSSQHPEVFLNIDKPKPGSVDAYAKAIALIKTRHAEKAIPLLKNHSDRQEHPWIKLALAEAYLARSEDKKALDTLKHLTEFYPDYLPVTLAYASALVNDGQARTSIRLLKHQLQTSHSPEIYKILARAYFKNGQVGAALEATGNQYEKEGYYELALQQYDNALQQPDISKTTKKRLETKKDQLKALQH